MSHLITGITALFRFWVGVANFFKGIIENHFDKLLLASLFVYMTVVLLHMSHDSSDAADVSWAREQSNLIVGALLGLITGAVLRNGSRPPEEK